MKKISILFMTVAYISAFSQKDTSIILKEVEVNASRQTLTLKEAPKNIYVISSEEIKTSTARSIADILYLVPGIDVRSRGPFGIQTDVGIRGGTFDQTLIMIDGIKLLDPQTGHHAMNVPIQPEDIERIEILPGGASRMFGQGAFSGAINIVTKTQKEKQNQVDLIAGQNGLFEGIFQLNRTIKNTWKFYNSVNFLKHNGYIFNTDAERFSLNLKANKSNENNSFSFIIGVNTSRFGAQNFYSFLYPEQHETIKHLLTAISYTYYGDLWTHKLNIYYREHHDRFELFREGRNFYSYSPENYFIKENGDTAKFLNGVYYRGHNFHLTRTSTIDWHSTLDMGFFGNLNLGYEFRTEWIWSNRLGFNLMESIKMPFEENVLLTRYHNRINNSFSIDHYLPITKKVSVNYGIWKNINSFFGSNTLYGLDILWKKNQKQSFWIGFNKAFRMPTYTDLFYNVGGAIGSINLKPEISFNYEVGMRRFTPSSSSSISFFIRDSKQLIDWIRYPDSNQVFAANITQVLFYGMEGFFKKLFNKNPLRISWIQVNASYTDFTRINQNFSSLYALDILKYKVALSTSYRLIKNLDFSHQIIYLNRKGTYRDSNNSINTYPETILVNIKATYTLHKNTLYLEISNMFDQIHMDRGGIVLPGRWIRVGWSHNF
ncbi:TonB-dependent receptor [Thermaurantimonas aggregans]|uniref:TonB-dependent receptor n=1 Tax=Thermaurantimonas aggregans TaxID=2173829 RepID=A0A401XKZ6_9FLAO|nr:TonB-dependent receptor [Thermaurantimonas aggregans]MCX8148234.1 TonB-dependent receptor [Thermaurantimonas aggregans]GCD77660.1 TonB-dependent receptor [Thermaurantimonas aggregans]